MPHALQFLAQFVRDPVAVGAVAPSSSHLARVMLDSFDWENVDAAVEFGPGTGAFTRFVPERLRDGARFFAVERNGSFVARLRDELPGVDVAHDSIERVAGLCDERGLGNAGDGGGVDAVVCGLPWAAFPESLQRSFLEATLAVLKPGGRFATFAYLQGLPLPAGRRFRALLDDHFGTVEISRTVWRNVPPAVVYRCER